MPADWIEGSDGDLSPGALKRLIGAYLNEGGPGSEGPPGEDGLSAYELAVLEGFEGDLPTWLASLEGAEGAAGAQGVPGSPGAPGDPGPEGDPGSPGSNGAAGEDGLSAYELAVLAGFVGNEAAWLASLVGPEGPQGEAGAASTAVGPEGPEGPEGPQGLQGPEGPEGPEGPAGGNPLDAWPVGSVFLAVVATSPATLLGGGTWARIAGGRAIVGQTASDVDFDTAEESGGAKTHTLTTAEIPSHTHVLRSQTATTGSATSYEHGTLDTSSAEAEATEVTDPTGGGGAHNNMPPYLVVYIWKRTA